MLVCAVEGCEREVKAKLLCDMHLQRLQSTGSVGKAYPNKIESRIKPTFRVKVCNAAGCECESVRMGLCSEHLKEFNLE